jgi:O-acetyl-ADP-ribose deacetylase (regulator of RNase III)
VDAIVNISNEDLWHGGGIAGAISRKGGPIIQNESRAYVKVHGRVPITHCAYTNAGNLACKYVLHAIAPKWSDNVEPNLNVQALT